MQKAFNISIAIFLTALGILVLTIFANIGLMDEALKHPAYGSSLLKPIIQFLKAIDTADFYLTIVSGISSLVTYIGKTIFR